MLNRNDPPQADKLVKYSGDGISVRGINVTYRNGHTALWDATFEIPRGSIAALVGVNGAGKSTLFKAIMGFVPVDGGKIRISKALTPGEKQPKIQPRSRKLQPQKMATSKTL